jgi:hypothetical protein
MRKAFRYADLPSKEYYINDTLSQNSFVPFHAGKLHHRNHKELAVTFGYTPLQFGIPHVGIHASAFTFVRIDFKPSPLLLILFIFYVGLLCLL